MTKQKLLFEFKVSPTRHLLDDKYQKHCVDCDEDLYINLNKQFGKDFQQGETIKLLIPKEKTYVGIRPIISESRLMSEMKLEL